MNKYTFYADRPVEKYRKTDKGLLVATLLLWGLGIFTLFITSPDAARRLRMDPYYYVTRQLISSAIGFMALLFFALLPMEKIRKILPVIVIGTLVLCLLALIPGIGKEETKGARRWISLPMNFTFQPSEAAKFAVVLFLANLFDKQQDILDESQRSVLPSIVGLVLFVLIIFIQNDFSTGLFIFCVGILMFFVSGAKMSWLAPFTVLAVPAALFMIFISQNRINRLVAFISPYDITKQLGYQAFTAERAIKAGGLWGQGLGSGLTMIKSVPEVHNDYVFVGWAEAMGFVGVIAFFIVLGFFTWRCVVVSLGTPNRFAAYGSFGCMLMIVMQSLLNCAVVSRVVPSTGIPLPFFSYGGSSIIITMCMVGFILNASHCDAPEDYKTESFDDVVVEK